MSITLGDAVVYLVTDDQKLKAGLASGESQVQSFGSRVGGFLTNAASFAVGGLLQTGISKITSSIGGLASEMISSNAAFEDYETRFKVLLGSSEAAKERMAELADFGARTPFELPGVVQADLIIQAFGLHSEEAAKKFGYSGKEIREIAGDVASGTGRPFDEMATLIGKFASGATGEAIMRFQELGIATREQLSEMGLEFSKSGQLLSPLPQSMNVLLGLMKDKYGGLMAEQSLTFNGMMSNLKDFIGGTIRVIGAPIFDVLKTQLSNLLTFLNDPAFKEWIQNFAEGLASGVSQVMDIVNGLILLFQDFRAGVVGVDYPWEDVFPPWLAEFMYSISDTLFTVVIPALQQLSSFITDTVVPGILAFGDQIITVIIPALIEFIAPIVAQVIPGLMLIGDVILQLASVIFPLLLQAWAFLMDHLNIVIPILAVVGAIILALTSPISLVIGAIVLLATAWANNWGNIQGIVQAVMDFIMPLIQTAMNFVSTVISTTLTLISNWWKQHGDSVMVILTAFWNFVQTIFTTYLAAVWFVIQTILTNIQVFWRTWGDEIMAVTRVIWDTISTIVSAAMEVLGLIIDAAAALIKGDWQAFGDALRNIWTAVWSAMRSIFESQWNLVKAAVQAGIQAIRSMWDGFTTGLTDGWNSLWDGMIDVVESATGTINDMVTGITDAINDALALLQELVLGQPEAGAQSLGAQSFFNRGGGPPPPDAMLEGASVVNNYFNLTIPSLSTATQLIGEFEALQAKAST